MEKTKNNKVFSVAVIGIKLLLICAIIAGIVSFVYDLTLKQYEQNIQETKNKAIGQIFGKEGLDCRIPLMKKRVRRCCSEVPSPLHKDC